MNTPRISTPPRTPDPPASQPPDEEASRQKRQRQRSLAIAFSLLALCILFFLVTIVRFGGQAPLRPKGEAPVHDSAPEERGAPQLDEAKGRAPHA